MKSSLFAAASLASLLAVPALAQSDEGEGTAGEAVAGMPAPTGDAAAGEDIFNKRCVTCHMVVNASGEKLAGKAARTGPNLFNVAGHPAGKAEGFRYGPGIEEAAGQGLVWTEENFVKYVQDPRAFLQDFTGDSAARSKMSFKLKGDEDSANVYAYLASLNGM